jgi:mannan endo-1,4-beta-mannosidase
MVQTIRPYLLRVVSIFGALAPTLAAAPTMNNEPWPIIVRHGDALYEGERPFRFLGLAAPNLHQNEGQLLPDFSNRFPDEFEIRDVLRALQQMGARATRCFALSITAPSDGGVPVYISGRRNYNEAAFRTLDRVLALCPEYDVRVIIPLIIAQNFVGWRGVDEFAALAGKPGSAFWTDPEIKDDFRDLIRYVLNRRNTVSGLLYRDDPAILAWQLGNEFPSWWGDRRLDEKTWKPRVTAWSCEMAACLKQVDPRHLVMEGGGDRAAFIADPNIDVLSTHLYEYWNRLGGGSTDLAALARADRAETLGRKPLIIDEFGLGSLETIRQLMRAIREDGIVGGLLWGIRGHRRDGGFYYHNEGGTPVNSYHWPGFATGHGYDERRILDLLRTEAYAIRGEELPPLPKPSPVPVLLRAGAGFTWRGSTGASSYTLERAGGVNGPWQCLAAGLEDSVIADVRAYEEQKISAPEVLCVDESAPAGTRFFYRLKAANAAGETNYSNVVECARP